ncbi:hypothetical protein [Cryptosporangium japonicum]|uniref:Uncharacterized protein n=1 Tax=Cryptosporangium japonicum TaxID=80872 RepID=A0ABP3E003_9ACTN
MNTIVGTNDSGAGAGELDAELIDCQSPADVLQATGRWLASRLANREFEWHATRRSLEAKVAGRLERIGFVGSKYNRTGRLIEVQAVNLGVYDEGLGRWRRLHAPLTVSRPPSVANIVCYSSYLDLSPKSTLLTDPQKRVAAAGALVAELEEIALPWLGATRDPTELAGAVPDGLLRPWAFAQDLLEYLVSLGLTDQAQALIRRFTAISAAHAEAFAEGRRMAVAGERPTWHSAPAFGWSSEVLDLV